MPEAIEVGRTYWVVLHAVGKAETPLASSWHLLIVLVFAVEAHADSYGPFCDFIRPDASGMRYAVVTYSGDPPRRNHPGPTEIVICQRRPNASPIHRDIVEVKTIGAEYVITDRHTVAVHDDDTVDGRIRLDYTPDTVRVSSAGNGIAVIDCFGVNYGFLTTKAAVRLFTSAGQSMHDLHLKDLFSGGADRFSNGTGSVIWCSGAWYDDRRNAFVLVSSGWKQPPGRHVAVVDLKRGAIQRGGTREAVREIERAIVERNQGALSEAITLAGELKVESINPELPSIVIDEGLPLPARLRAAVVMASRGDKRGATLLETVVLSSTRADMLRDGYHQEDTVIYSIRYLNQVLGDAALPIHREAVRRYGEMAIHVPETFMPFGKKAVPYLIDIARNERHDAVLAHAVYMLGELRNVASDAVPVLIDLVNDTAIGSMDTRRYCVLALGRIGPSAAAALPTLRRCSMDEDASMRAAARAAIDKIASE